MQKISTGIHDLDSLIDFAHIGDNVVWEIEAGTSEDRFINAFIKQSLAEENDVIYVSFNRSPQSILLNLDVHAHAEKLTILDCFTSGKGKSDRAFLKFYDAPHPDYPKVSMVNRPADISRFSETVNASQEGLSEGARYIFDSLTGMQDLWGDESSTYKFFTYMCPRLYDLRTVAFWVLEKEAHSQTFKANLRHITQVVLDLYKKKDKLFLKALKLDGRTDREAFKPHSYEINQDGISITPIHREPAFDIGSKIRESRTKAGMSQKDLADKIGFTSSFVSQVENNQISPSLNSFLQIANALNLNPAILLKNDRRPEDLAWFIRNDTFMKSPAVKEHGFTLYTVTAGEKASAFFALLRPGTTVERHFMQNRKEEILYVLKGNPVVTVNAKEKKLSSGDVLHLKDVFPSAWANRSDKEVELLIFCY